MITLLVYWISCYYNKEVSWLYLGSISIDLSLIEALRCLIIKK